MNTAKVCVVTGSSSGIGSATAKLFASKGWNVVINYSRAAAPAETVADACRALGAEVLVVKCNVADDDDCRRVAAEVEASWGRVDVLVNNAGTNRFVGLKDLEGECNILSVISPSSETDGLNGFGFGIFTIRPLPGRRRPPCWSGSVPCPTERIYHGPKSQS